MGDRLNEKLDERRFEAAIGNALDVLSGLAIEASMADVLSRPSSAALWQRYIRQLRDCRPLALHWPREDEASIASYLTEVARSAGDRESVWLTYSDPVAIGVRVPAQALLSDSLTYFVTRASDLMLSSPDASDGICVELNAMPGRTQFEIKAWGAFETEPGENGPA